MCRMKLNVVEAERKLTGSPSACRPRAMDPPTDEWPAYETPASGGDPHESPNSV